MVAWLQNLSHHRSTCNTGIYLSYLSVSRSQLTTAMAPQLYHDFVDNPISFHFFFITTSLVLIVLLFHWHSDDAFGLAICLVTIPSKNKLLLYNCFFVSTKASFQNTYHLWFVTFMAFLRHFDKASFFLPMRSFLTHCCRSEIVGFGFFERTSYLT